MNAITPIDLGAATDWEKIYTEVNAWRGACIHHFSFAEMAVTETLLALDAVKLEGTTVRLRHLIGQRFEDLADAIGPKGAFANKGKSAAAALDHYRKSQEMFRTQLCHGTIKVTVQQSGTWLLIMRSLTIRASQADRHVAVLDQLEAIAKLVSLKRDAKQLSATLGQLRKSVVNSLLQFD